LTVAGTSGGIPYFNSTTTWASSALLVAKQQLFGGGAGGAPASGGWYNPSGGAICNASTVTASNFCFADLSADDFSGGSAMALNWFSSTDLSAGSDTSIRRGAAGLLDVGNGLNANCATAANCRDIRFRHDLCQGTAPSITTHFNTSGDSLATGSSDCSFIVNVGTGAANNTGIVTFGTAWANPPTCAAQDSTTLGQLVSPVTTTTTVTLNGWISTTGIANNWTNSDVLLVQCKGH